MRARRGRALDVVDARGFGGVVGIRLGGHDLPVRCAGDGIGGDLAEVALVHAIELFPDYYDALELLGSEYVKHAYYDSAAPLLARAVQVNKDEWRSFYGLGVSLIELDRRGEGLFPG